MSKYYTIYKITNKINKKIYVGCHQTDNLNDNYMGSGSLIKKAIEKYGLENFTKEILIECDNVNDMLLQETLLVNADFVKRFDTYNVSLGGRGSFEHININPCLKRKANINSQKTQNDLRKNNAWSSKKSDKITTSLKEQYSSGKRVVNEGFSQAFSGKTHSQDSKRKIGKANSIHQTGSKNSQYGTKWIYNLELKTNKKIKNQDQVPNGWLLGRKMKF